MPSVRKCTVLLIASLAAFGAKAQEDLLLDDDAWLVDLLLSEEEDEGFDTSVSEDDIDAIDKAIDGLFAWNQDLSLGGGLGWSDNALLEENGGVDSAVGQIELDYFAIKPGLGIRTELVGIVYGEYRYYEDIPGLSAESLLIAEGSAMHPFSDMVSGYLKLEAARSVQAYDASIEDFETDATTVRFFEPGARVGSIILWGERSKLSVGGVYSDADYDQEGEGYETVGAEFAYEYGLGKESVLSISGIDRKESYHERVERLSSGTLVDAPLLEIGGRDLIVEWERNWEKGWLKEISTRLRLEEENDGLGDYFERDGWQLRQKAVFDWNNWRADVGVSFGEIDYDSRRVDPAREETRSDEYWRWNLELERKVGEQGTFFMRYSGSEKESNASGLSYHGKSILLGFRVSGILH